ncbi:MAG: glycoside hydrolase family 78 protein [Kiritimatiellae bacterium]|nr:glycoside hydrolase family 78 protein [Kiritimatiellia bacterium]
MRPEMWILFLAASSLWFPPSVRAALRVEDLRCEHLVNPTAVETAAPRLRWRLSSERRGDRPTAWQVLVARSAAALAEDRGELWDSGQQRWEEGTEIRYGGTPLRSGETAFWKVRVWDREGQPSGWSGIASWTMGITDPSEWAGAEWIGLDGVTETGLLMRGSWIWTPERPEPPGARYFRRVVVVPDGGDPVRRARLLAAADNLADIYCNGERVGRVSSFKASGEFDLMRHLHGGTNVLAVRVENLGGGPNPAGWLAVIEVEHESGRAWSMETDAEWRCATNEPPGWPERLELVEGWMPVRAVGRPGDPPWGAVALPADRRQPARWLRREFALTGEIRRAVVHYSALGLGELWINGRRIGDEVLWPPLTHYDARVPYVTRDVTEALQTGSNAIGVILGNGRYYAPRLVEPTETLTYGWPKLRLCLAVEFTDGRRERLVSDASWRMTTNGPVLANNEYDGEDYDARREMRGWASAGFDESGWWPAQRVGAPAGRMWGAVMPPIRVTETLRPREIRRRPDGRWIVDMGQNMVGWCRIRVRGPRGTVVTLRHAETLNAEGELYLDNIRGAKVTDRYVLRGEGVEEWEPRFTYHGFRFVEVEGWPGELTAEMIDGRVVHDDVERVGEWSCSDPLLNQIFSNAVWGIRGNYRSIPTDCPQRDERQGWLGDRSAECHGEMFLFDLAAFYAKWTRDIVDAQRDNGSVPNVAPPYWPIYTDNMTWPSSLLFVPRALLDHYDDRVTVAEAWPAMVRWMEHMQTFVTNGIQPRDTYGDWCVPPEDPKLIHSKDLARKTAGPLIGTAYFAKCAEMLAEFARLLGRGGEAARYERLARETAAAFHREFFRPADGWYDNGTATACILPLRFGLVPEAERGRVAGRLVDKLEREAGGHVMTGLIGGQWLMRTLTDLGRADLAWTLATRESYPSWGYMVRRGATTIWELWNGDTADPAMNSHNHVMLLGDLVIWMFENLAGIANAPDRSGFRRLRMRPEVVPGCERVRAVYRAVSGRIESEWASRGRELVWEVCIPPGVTAELWVPAASVESVREEGGGPAAAAEGVRAARQVGDRVVLEVESGRYRFTVRR